MSSVTKTFLNKCLSLSYLGDNWNNELAKSIVEAGRTISYVETLSPNKADKFHLSVRGGDKRLFMREFEKRVRFALDKLKLKGKRVKIAFDSTEDLTWCKSGFFNLRPLPYSQELSWQYLNVSIVEPYFLPLMSIPYRQVDSLDILAIDLLNYVKSLPIVVGLVLFDRGFYHAHLIDYLNGNRWPYLMLVPQRKRQLGYIEQTRNANKVFAFFNHMFNYKKYGSSWKTSTNIMVKIVDDKTAWCYATNLSPSLKLCKEYSIRWNIETGFRIHDEARIKSKSKILLIRFFYHLLGMLLVILWRIKDECRKGIVFKRFLKWLEYQFYPPSVKLVYPPPPL